MKNIHWGIVLISSFFGAFSGLLVGLLSQSLGWGIITFLGMTIIYIWIICLTSANSRS